MKNLLHMHNQQFCGPQVLTWHKVGVKYNKLTICGPGFFLTAKEDFEKKNLEKAGKGSEKPAVT